MEKDVDFTLTNIVIFSETFKGFMPSVDIQSGIILLILSIGTLYLITQVIEKEIIFKWMFILLLLVSFFTILFKIEIIDSIATYTTSVELGVIILLVLTFFISWDEDSVEYN